MGDAQATPRLNGRNLAFLISTIFALLALFAFAGNAGAATRTGGTGTDPWISSDLPDYPPGATVNLLGGSWQSGEIVHVHVNDNDGQTWVRDVDVAADANGDISDSFNLPDWFVANYAVTATGASGSVATTSFTDAIQTTTILTSSPNPSSLNQSVTFTATITCSSACTFGSQTVDFVENANQNCNGGTTLGSTNTLTGSGSITRQATFSTSSLTAGTHLIRACFRGGGSGTTPGSSTSDPALSQVVNGCTAPAVTTQPSDQSVAYGADTSFTSAASGTSPSVQWQVSTNGGVSYSNVSGQTTTTLSLTKPPVSASGNRYRAVFTNACGSATSNAAMLTVAQKSLTISGATANNKTYDGSATATVNFGGASLVGVVSGDTVTIDSSGYVASFATKTVGTAKPVTVVGVVLGGTDSGNYTVSQPTGLAANITARDLTVSAAGVNKTYDGTADATVTLSTDNLSGDAVSAAYTSASFANRHAGTAKAVSVSGISISGADASNYHLTNTTASASADIAQRPITVSAVTDSKVYDGTTSSSATPAITLGTLASGDTASFSQVFGSKNVGTGKTLTPSGSVSDGNGGNDYAVTFQNNTTGVISAKGLTISGASANDKTYDGNANATVDWSGASLNGVVGSDDVSIDHSGYAAHFDNRNVGTAKAVTVSGVTLSGSDAGNYSVSQPSGLAASVTAKGLTITGAHANDRTYDATNSATVDWSGASLVGVVSGDGVSIDHSSYSASFADKNVGTGKAVTVSGVALGGSDASNYSVSQPSGLTANIGQARLDIYAVGDSKTYDGTTGSSGAPTLGAGQVQGTDSVDGLSQAFHSKDALGAGNSVLEVTGYAVHDGNSGGNYDVHTHTASGTIGAKGLTISGAAANNKTYDGTDTATVNWSGASLNGVVGSDDVSIDHSGYAASFANKNAGTSKPVTVVGVVLGGSDASNYSVSQPSGLTANIGQARLDIYAVGDSKTYDGTTGSSGTPTLGANQVQGTDTVDGLTQAFHSKDALGAGNSVLEVTGYAVHDGNSGGNYDVHTHTASGTINAKGLTISGAVANSKTYDSTTAATVDWSGASLTGVISGDDVSIDHSGYAASFGDKNVGTGKAVTVTGVALSGSGASNYSVAQPSGLTADITARDLTVSAAGVNKTYDGTADATVTLSTDKLSGDAVSAAYTSASFANKHVGSAKAVSVSGISISGADASNYHLTNTTASTSADITQRPITVSAVTDSKTYDGSTGSAGTPFLAHGSIAAGDTPAFSQAFASKTAGTGKTLIPTGSVIDGNAGGNYDVTFENDTSGVITARGLTISGAQAVDKTYDGNDHATVDWSGASLNGVVGSDDVSIDHSGYAAHFGDKNVGTDKPVTVTGVALSGSDSGNYSVSQPSGLKAAIGAKELSVSFQADDKTYDGNSVATIKSSPAPSLVGVVSGDDVSLDGSSASAHFGDKNVGTGKTVTASGFTKSGTDAGNYVFASPQGQTTAAIGAKGLTISGAAADNKTYDGNASATVNWSGASLNGVVSGDSVAIDHSSYSAHFDSRNVGTAKPVTVSGVGLSGGDAANYGVAQPSGLTATISAKGLTISGAVANGKTYDGNAGATVDWSGASLNGVVSGDDVSIDHSGYSASFPNKNAGTGKAVTVTGAALGGGDAGNYSVAQPTGLTASIDPLVITGSFTAAGKVYDGNRSAAVTGRSLNGVLGSDDVTLTGGTATFDNENVGANKPVSLSGAALSGTDRGNYSLTSVADAHADITAKQVSVSFQAANKTYDGNSAATFKSSPAPSLVGVVSGDDVSLDGSSASASFADKNVGTGKTVTASGFTKSGTDAGNYVFAGPQGQTTADITPKQVSVSFQAANKTYDGTAVATIKSTPAPSLVGVVSGDTVNLDGSSASASFANKNVGTGKAVTASGFTKSGTDAGNYVFAGPQGQTTADIGARSLTVSAYGINKTYDGTNAATVTLGTDAVSGDDVTPAYTTAAFVNKNAGTGKTVTVSGLTISGSDAPNYNLLNPTATTTATIRQLGIVGNFTAASKVYDGTTAATVLSRSLAVPIAGDDVSLSGGTAAFADPLVGSNKLVSLTGASLTGADAANYNLTVVNTALASITAWNAAGYGFYQPVGIANSVFVAAPGLAPAPSASTIWNTAKGGSTIPLKFNVYGGGVEKTSLADIRSFTQQSLTCSTGAGTDPVDMTVSGNTTLRYDTTAMQWIQNWKTPSSSLDVCYRATVTFADGSSLSAFFKFTR